MRRTALLFHTIFLLTLTAGVPANSATVEILGLRPDEPAVVMHGVRELRQGLSELHGLEVPVKGKEKAAPPSVLVVVGEKAFQENQDRLQLPGLEVKSDIEGAHCVYFSGSASNGVIAVLGNGDLGLSYGLLEANVMLYVAYAENGAWPPEQTVQRAPRVPLRGMYNHILYGHNYPWPPRKWSADEHFKFNEMLTYFGFNVLMTTPGIGVMQTPLTDLGKQGIEWFAAQEKRANSELGMVYWPGDAANEVTYKEDPVPIFQRGLGPAEWVDPGDPQKLKDILDNRAELFKVWPDLSAFWVIDGDPGGYPGSTVEEFVNILTGLRERMTAAGQRDAAMVYWQWTTWSPELDENTGLPVLKMLKERMDGKWYAMVSADSTLRYAKEAGILDRTIYFPYHLVEFEPHGPFTNPRFDDIRKEINKGIEDGAKLGSFCNAMSPLVQLPNIAYYGECLWFPEVRQPEPVTVMKQLAALVLPEHADVLAGAWMALGTDPSSPLVGYAKEKLDTLLAENETFTKLGPVGRRLFPSVRFHLECLDEMLSVHAKAGPARDAIRRYGFTSQVTEDALVDYVDAYLVWIKKTGFWHPRRLLSGQGYHWINSVIVEGVRARATAEDEARRMLLRVEERTRDTFPEGAHVAVRQLSRGVVNFDEVTTKEVDRSLKDGDIIVIDVGGELAEVVRRMTRSPYTHCGIVKNTDKGPYVIEGTNPTREVPYDEFMGQARGGYYVHLRVIDVPSDRIQKVIAEAEKFLGRPYDFQMKWDDDAIYCSELVWKAFQRGAGKTLGKRYPLKDLDWQPHEEFIRRMSEDGTVPLDREIITPAELVRNPYVRILENTFPK